ncbi:hypothetical protein FHS85_005131 [Rhodoligotrophos appendicifer]|uniref:hypothetical protein n=1 Tax=Rhodoligotrophos appendicifer TaxID=987056 RepID=UPI00117EA16E|nr:hypothetical protein [Rhodoligotrophos appendicifer]
MATLGAAAVASAIFLTASPAFAEEYEGTAEERTACIPDAIRLCSEFIPSAEEVKQCLFRRARDLNPDCKKVITGAQRSGSPAN